MLHTVCLGKIIIYTFQKYFLRAQCPFCCCANTLLAAHLSQGALFGGNPLILFPDVFASTDCITDSLIAIWQPPASAEGSLRAGVGSPSPQAPLRCLLGDSHISWPRCHQRRHTGTGGEEPGLQERSRDGRTAAQHR